MYFGKEKVKTGKMPVKKLIKQGKGAQKIELDGEDIHLFNRLAKKYGVDYAVVKDKEVGTYKIFFKAQDADAIIDRDDNGTETVHFLNMMDEADLLSLMDEDEQKALQESLESAEKEMLLRKQ